MSRHEAVAFVINTALQLAEEGVPFQVAHRDDEIAIYLKGFVMSDDGAILEPEAQP